MLNIAAWQGGATPPFDPPAFRPAAGAAPGRVRRPPNPIAGAAAERYSVVADDLADGILDGPAVPDKRSSRSARP